MKLIDEKEVEEAACKHAGVEVGKYVSCSNDESWCSKYGFMDGVEFAEQKLLHVMVEFAEWCPKTHVYCPDKYLNIWYDHKGSAEFFTTEQLLEQFLKNRTK